MKLTQLVHQWNTSAEALQQSPTVQADTDSVQVRTSISAGEKWQVTDLGRGIICKEDFNGQPTGECTNCTWSSSATPGCYN